MTLEDMSIPRMINGNYLFVVAATDYKTRETTHHEIAIELTNGNHEWILKVIEYAKKEISERIAEKTTNRQHLAIVNMFKF